MGEPVAMGQASSPGVTGAMRRPTVSNPAAAARADELGRGDVEHREVFQASRAFHTALRIEH